MSAPAAAAAAAAAGAAPPSSTSSEAAASATATAAAPQQQKQQQASSRHHHHAKQQHQHQQEQQRKSGAAPPPPFPTPEEARRRGISLEGLLSLLHQQLVRRVKAAAGEHRRRLPGYCERYRAGESLPALAKRVDYPPYLMARMMVEVRVRCSAVCRSL